MKRTLRPACLLASLTLLGLMPLSAWGQGDGKVCPDPPVLSVEETGYDTHNVLFRAPDDARYVLQLNYLTQSKKPESLEITVPPLCEIPADDPHFECKAFEPCTYLRDQSDGDAKDQADCDAKDDAQEPKCGVTFCLLARADKEIAIPFTADRGQLLADGGQLGVRWYRHPQDESSTTCRSLREGPDRPTLQVLRKHALSIDTGFVFNLEDSGSWDPNFEVALSAISQWNESFHAGTQIRYSAIGAISEESDPESDGSETDPTAFNPFESGDGVYAFDSWLKYKLPKAKRVGPLVGIGFSSLPNDDGSGVSVKANHYFGFALDVAGYNVGTGSNHRGARSFLHIALAEDDLFENVLVEPASEDGTTPAVFKDESERYLMKADLVLPNLGGDFFRLMLRTYASIPRSGDGPSDIRISALVSTDPRSWFPSLGGSE